MGKLEFKINKWDAPNPGPTEKYLSRQVPVTTESMSRPPCVQSCAVAHAMRMSGSVEPIACAVRVVALCRVLKARYRRAPQLCTVAT